MIGGLLERIQMLQMQRWGRTGAHRDTPIVPRAWEEGRRQRTQRAQTDPVGSSMQGKEGAGRVRLGR